MTSDLSIVIVSYNSAHVIGALLDSIPEAVGDLTTETIVVDNGSADATRDIVSSRSDCRLIESLNVGYAGGVNRGIAASDPRSAVLVLNPDIRLHPGAVPPLLETLAEPGTGIAAPMVLAADGSLHHSLRREPTLWRAAGLNATKLALFSEYVNRPGDYTRPAVADWALGAALLLSRQCVETVGPWDESFFLYSEETDYCLRARDLGLVTRYEPRSQVTHIGAQSGQSAATHAMQIINRVRLYHRRTSRPRAWLYYALTLASEFTWAVRGNTRSRFAIRALLRPALRPAELDCSNARLPG